VLLATEQQIETLLETPECAEESAHVM